MGMIHLGQIVLTCLMVTCALLWLGWCVFVLRVARKDTRLALYDGPADGGAWPSISVCIPARDEERDIEGCLSSILAQEYPAFEVIVVDDRSTDHTGEIVEQFAQRDPRVRLLRVEDCPAGWTGKCHALWRATQQATGEWLLFVDVDTRHDPLNFKTVLHEATRQGADMVSLVCRPRTESLFESVVEPLLGTMLLGQFRFEDVNRIRHPKAFANGQYILIRRETYDDIGGHEAVRGHILEDVAMAFRVKRSKWTLRVMWGVKVSSVRMYGTMKEMLHGWSRIYCGAFGIEPSFYMAFIVAWFLLWALPTVGIAAGVVLLATGTADALTYVELVLAGVTVAACLATMGVSYRLVEHPGIYAIFSPIGAVFQLVTLCRSLWLIAVRKSIPWRGCEYKVDPDRPFGVF